MTEEHLINDIKIRDFDAEKDAEAVRVIVGQVWHGGADALIEKQFGVIGGKPWGEWQSADVLSYLTDDGARSFVAEKEGQVVGFCSYVIDRNCSRGTVGYNAVAPGQQGQGLGSAMMSSPPAGSGRRALVSSVLWKDRLGRPSQHEATSASVRRRRRRCRRCPSRPGPGSVR